jgi:hypothetical protein
MSFPLERVEGDVPRVSYSGRSIKSRVIRAMEEQRAAVQQASDALDAMILALQKAQSVPPPPAGEGTRYRGVFDSTPEIIR